MSKFDVQLAGVVVIIIGIITIIDPGISLYFGSVHTDISDYNTPFAILLILIGIYFFSLAEKKSSEEKKQNEYYICPDCLTPVEGKDIPDLKCLKCSTQLEELEGFYDRHPEKR